MPEELVGEVTHYFGKPEVGIIAIQQGKVVVGDTLHFKGHTTDFTQTVDSMQLEYQPVTEAVPEQSVGIKVKERVRAGDKVYKVTP